jgi:hypothetical protein
MTRRTAGRRQAAWATTMTAPRVRCGVIYRHGMIAVSRARHVGPPPGPQACPGARLCPGAAQLAALDALAPRLNSAVAPPSDHAAYRAALATAHARKASLWARVRKASRRGTGLKRHRCGASRRGARLDSRRRVGGCANEPGGCDRSPPMHQRGRLRPSRRQSRQRRGTDARPCALGTEGDSADELRGRSPWNESRRCRRIPPTVRQS